jgi:flagellar biosynthesis chaperone FliJ
VIHLLKIRCFLSTGFFYQCDLVTEKCFVLRHDMTEQGFKGFQRGEYGSTAEHLTSLQYQIKQDKERLEKLQKRIQREQIKYEPARNVSKTYNEIDRMGQKTITGKMAISKED